MMGRSYRGGRRWFELFSDLYFLADIFINFRTGFVSEEHQLVMNAKEIRRRYLKGWFMVDAVACLPVGYVTQFMGHEGGDGQQLKAFKTLRLFRLAKLLRLARIRRIIKRWEESIGSLMSIVKLVFLLFVVLFMTHVIACCYYLIGSNSPDGWTSNADLAIGEEGALVSGSFTNQTLTFRYGPLFLGLHSLVCMGHPPQFWPVPKS